MPNYIYNNNVYSQQQVEQAAAAKQMSLEEYINKFGIKTVGDQKQEEEEKLESISWFDQTWFGRGFKAASTTGEATNLMAQDFSNISEDAIQDFIKAKEKESTTYQESSSMKAFQKQYIKEGKTWAAFFRGVRRNPKLLPELFIQSIGTQVGTLADSPGATLAAVGAGAVTGGGAGATTFTPFGVAAGAIAGGFGGLATSMEAALTFGELIETRLKEKGLEFTDKNILELLEKEGKQIRNKALGRGLTIGAVEGLSGGLAGKAAVATKGVVRGAKKATVAGAAAGIGVEAVGGGVGEVGGRLAAGQEMDAAEIGFEAITGTTTAPINVGAALLTAKKPTYRLNGEIVTYEQMKDFVDTADDIDIAKADIQIKDDYTGVGKKAKAKQEAAEKMIELSGDEATIQEVKKAKEENVIKATVELLKQGKQIGNVKDAFAVENNEEAQAAFKKLQDQYGKDVIADQDVTDADGFFVPTPDGNVAIINKAVAIESGQINVGGHELLHAITQKFYNSLDDAGKRKFIGDFKKTLSKNSFNYIENIINERNKDRVDPKTKETIKGENLDLDTTDEWLNIYSDGIVKEEITYDESVVTKIRNFLHNIFRKFGYNKEFTSGIATYNFMRDYNKNIMEFNKISERALAVAGETTVDTEVKKSVSPQRRQQISDNVKEIGNTYSFEGGKTAWDQGGADNAITEIKEGKFLDDLIAAKYKGDRVPVDFVDKVYSELTNHIRNFNPETNDNLFGWINSQLANKAGNVFNREYKRTEQETTAKDVDDRTKEGEVKTQVAAEKDIAMQELEEQDISIAAEVKRRKQQQDKKPEYSKFRRKLGIETGSEIYNRVLDAARKALIRAYETGKPARNIQRNLRDEANTYLFKTIKNFLGTNTYISNLKKFRESIVDTMFTADLVQMEREVADDKRVFTKFVKQLTSKQEVQDAINRNELPASALNVIDKGQAVNLYKKVMPTEEQFIAFFDQPAVNPVTGKRSGLKGTRKDQLAKYMSGALAYDATMQVAQEADVIQKRQDIADLRGQEIPAGDLQILSEVIDRPVNVKFSRVSKSKFKSSLDIEVLNLDKKGLSFESQLMFLETASRNFKLGPEKAIELAFIKLNEQTINPADKAYLAKIIKEGVVDESYIKNVLKQIKAVTVKEIKKYGYNATVNRLKNKVKQASTKEQKVKIIKDFLINESKSIRTSKAGGITRNSQVYDKIIKELGVEGFSVVELKTKDGTKTRTFIKDGKEIPYTKIAFEGETLNTYAKVTDIKRNFANFIETINDQSKQAIDYVIDIVEDTSLSNLEKKAIIKLLTTDQVGAFRKISKAGMYVEGLLTKETTLDHEVTINDLYQKTIAAIDNKISANDLRSIFNKSRVNLIPKTIDNILNEQKLKSTGADRMHNKKVKKAVDKVDFKDKDKVYGNNEEKAGTAQSKATEKVRTSTKYSKSPRGMSTFDFDETLIDKGENFIIAKKGEETIKISSGDWPILGSALAEQGYEFDFNDFINVRGGVEGPLLQKMRNQIKKFGPNNVFVLTARPPQSAEAIHAWLKSKGINIPLENITGLGNSTGEAKAVWMLEKFAEGYNDMYFVDDALPNVEAVQNVLNQLDIKGKSVQVKTKFSKSIKNTLNKNKSYVKFKNSLKNSVFYHGGLSSLKNKNAVWFIVDDVNGAEVYSDIRGVMGEVYSVKASQLKDSIIIPDVNDSFGFDKIIKQKFPDQVKALVDDGQVKIDKILKQDNAAEIISEYINWADSNFKLFEGVYGPETLYDNSGKIAKSLPVIVLDTNVSSKAKEVKPSTKFSKSSLRGNKAVKNVLDQLDVKSKVVQTKVKFSKSMNKDFNKILEDVTGIDSNKRYSDAKARKRGEKKGRFRFFIPPSHEDFVGLLYNFIGKGEKGNKHRNFFEKALIKPLNRAYTELNMAKQAIANDYRNLIKQMPDVRKKLTKKIPGSDFTYEDAVRVYLWNKAGFDIPGLSKTDKKELLNVIEDDVELKSFADKIGKISRVDEGYIEPGDHWSSGNIKQDLADATGRVGRAKYFAEFIENADIIFSPENINKIRAEFGDNFVEALQDMLHATKTGTSRTTGTKSRIVNAWLDYINGSVAATMFINVRSAVLQTLSTVNFINFADNNIFKAAAAFANQKQFWSDFTMLFNSDYLKQRRAGAAFDLNASEIANAVSKSKNPVRAAISYILQKGFLPTQMADSFAIALGGASMYRNRVETYKSQGLSQKDAEAKAFDDFQEIAESTQQSARPDKLSQQQRSPLGRLILAFQNVTSQYARIIKKSTLDIVNRRKTPPYDSQVKSDMSNLSKILYYGGIQNIIFYSLQTAMFAMMFDDDEKDEEFFKTKKDRILSGSIDSILRGIGVGGAVISTIKNVAMKYHKQKEKGWNKEDNIIVQEALQLSPPIGIKARKISSFEKTMQYNKKVIPEMNTFDIDNPMWEAYANLIEGTTNAPVARFYRKQENIRAALDSRNQYWQRVFLFAGWDKWSLGVEDYEIEEVKKQLKKTNKRVNKDTKGKTTKIIKLDF